MQAVAVPSFAVPAPVALSMARSRFAQRVSRTHRAVQQRLVGLKQNWAGHTTSRCPVTAVETGADWAHYDAPTFLRRGLVIEGLPDWRQASSRI